MKFKLNILSNRYIKTNHNENYVLLRITIVYLLEPFNPVTCNFVVQHHNQSYSRLFDLCTKYPRHYLVNGDCFTLSVVIA